MLTPAVIRIADAVIEKVDREHPADAVLRTVLKRCQATPDMARRVSRAVFAFYRWRGWLDAREILPRQFTAAWQLVERFQRSPRSFLDDELRRRAVPGWIAAEMEIPIEWLRALQREPAVWLRARPGQAAALAEKLKHCRRAGEGLLGDALEYVGAEDLFGTEMFRAGEFEIQDLSSQWVGWLCDAKAGETWWDACAGEGGKLLHLSDLMQNRGLIWASDRAAWRLDKLRKRAARARVFNYRVVPWDGGGRLPTKTKFDGVLVDAPCSGVGTWHRNPHARWTITPADLAELRELQGRLLAHASAAVKPGGRLIYAVCTLTRAETLQVAEEFERRIPGFQPMPLVDPFRPHEPAQAQRWAWPQERGGNGMFVAAWQRQRSV
jgi:16S rRNA (cytosine967-C5)-methyltransferase